MRPIALIVFAGWVLAGCSAGPSPSNCYGSGQPGCEVYGKPKTVSVRSTKTKDFIESLDPVNKEKYFNRKEVLPSAHWHKEGAKPSDVIVALLECGAGEYMGNRIFKTQAAIGLDEYNNALVSIQRCMQADQFDYEGNFAPCDTQDLDACFGYPAKRNVSTRLSSTFCQNVGNYVTECLPPGKSFARRSLHDPGLMDMDRQSLQRDNNRQMNQMLRNTAPRMGR